MENCTSRLSIVDLPDDVLLAIFGHCDYKILLIVAQVCKTFYKLASQDVLWRPILERCLNIPLKRQRYCFKDSCKISFKWIHGKYCETTLVKFQSKLLPWLELHSSHLYVSIENCIQVYNHNRGQKKVSKPIMSVVCGEHDVTRFVVKNDMLINGSKNIVIVWNIKDKSHRKIKTLMGHTKSVYCVELLDDVVLSGSRDRSIRVKYMIINPYRILLVMLWSLNLGKCLSILNIGDPVRSLAVNAFDRTFVAGSAGYIPRSSALKLYDCETQHQLRELMCDSSGRHGAGILDLKFESPNILLSCGYDTAVRLWDMRINGSSCCVKKWEDPHDSAVYCIESDKKWMILSGTYRYGVIRMWDKRMDRSVRYYHANKHTTSSVYSLKFNHTKLFVALDDRVDILNFDLK